jgi:hypothetical protein
VDQEEIGRLVAAADRADYRSMARLARALHDGGLSEREVLGQCYDFELPAEFFAIAAEPEYFEDVELNGVTYMSPLTFCNQPWQMAVPLSRGGPEPQPDGVDRLEQWLLAIDPGFVCLLDHTHTFPAPGGYLCCYHVDELRVGRSTVFGVAPGDDATVEPTRLADSLLSLLHEWSTRRLRELEREAQLFDRGAGSVTDDELEVARRWLARDERLLLRLQADAG